MVASYTMSHLQKKGTPYASTIVSDNDIYLTSCHKCERTRFNHDNRDLELIIEGKRKLPDFLMCGHYPLAIVSQKVIDVWEKHNITGYTTIPIKKLIDRKSEQVHHDCQYHCITITGRIELDFEKMGVCIIKQCSTCGAVDYDKPNWEWGSLTFVKQDTYDGSDLFAARHFEATSLCSKKILEVAYKEKLTNFQFRPLESMFSYFGESPIICLKELFHLQHP